MKHKQVRVLIEENEYKKLKHKAIELNMPLNKYAGLVLSGYTIEKGK